MEDFDIMGVLAILALFIGLPWIVLHYVTKWKHAAKITPEDENLLDEMYNLARRLEDRVQTVERIVAADHPDFRPGLTSSQPNYSIDRRN
ncbi:envelope stress response membrane protein PspB [uncultured Sphingomonas sp.]|uniref:envelope stress response membrane protein PspB n=1 Tax=uncultured Sphingomonas sp. TaxID=158754 RepID=UPI0035CA957F